MLLIDKDSFSEGEENKSKSVEASINCSILGSLLSKHLKKLIIAHLNINSLRNKFEFLVDQVKGKVDLLMVSENSMLKLKQKWLICCSYNPNKHNIRKHIEALSKSIDLFSSNYENVLLMGDFNAGLDNAVLKDFAIHIILQI